MAAICNIEDGRNYFDMNRQINGWMLEFICKTIWEEFKETHQVQSSSRDFVQGILSCFVDRTPYNTCRIQLLVIMCKLMDGEQYGMMYREDGNLTVLEEVVISFDSLVNFVSGCNNIRDRSDECRTLILKQAVFVCCRAGDFEIAEKVVERQWTDVTESALDAQIEVLEVLHSEDDHHETVMSSNYEDFLNKIVLFLEEIFDSLPEPFLVKLARKYDGIVMDNCDAYDSVNSSYCKVANKLKHTSPTSLGSRATARLKDKLHRCRTQTMKELAMSESNSPGRKSQSRQERKQSKQNYVQNETEALHNGIEEDRLDNTPYDRINVLLKRAKQNREQLKMATKNYAERFPLTPRFLSSEDESEAESSQHKNKYASTSVNIHNFKYRRNRNRSSRYVEDLPEPNSEVSDISIEAKKRPPHLKRIEGQHTIKPELQYEPELKVKKKPSYRAVWNEKEEEAFYLKVKEHGVGNWTAICKALRTFRTNVSLKDKWRQLNQSGRIKELIKKYGTV